MYIESLTLRNFRCFGPEAEVLNFKKGTNGFVGDNGAGKSSTLEALKRLFSTTTSERRLRRSDIHFGPGEDSHTVVEREVSIDVVFNLGDGTSVPYVFNDTFFDSENSELKARVVLEGKYVKSDAYVDDIETTVYSVRTLEHVPFGAEDERKVPMRGRAGQFAELVYIPAHRDSLGVMKHALKNVLSRLERSADWSDETKKKASEFAESMQKTLSSTDAVKLVTQDLRDYWQSLHSGHYDSNPSIGVVASEFEQLLRELTLHFTKSPGGGQRNLEELSEGQVSLLYFALSATLHGITRQMEAAEPAPLKGFKALDFTPPPLTIFALEEPENHLAPFYLPRLMGLLDKIHEKGGSQAFVTSHSTSVLTRIKPKNVNYFRHCQQALTTRVRAMPLPDDGSLIDKFLNQVILANPEIYFAKLVIIGEGDSERIVIPRVASAFKLELDPSFVAFVPIGGRHAQHLWALLRKLEIPHLTLLDFDLGRNSAGMGRIKNAATWLKEIGYSVDLSTIIQNDKLNVETYASWEKWLRPAGVFFSTPIDLDLMMIRAFPAVYKTDREYDPEKDDIAKISISVFGDKGKGNGELKYIGDSASDQELFKYKKLFKSNSKPGSHLMALGDLCDKDIADNCPEPLKALIEAAKNALYPKPPEPKVEGGQVFEECEEVK
ncbi:ATP-dependent nuclease [Roseovarius nubinhibens]|uniref:ATP-dependent nuclease n=1 Tax=Roseovarius nubinhibens TaxID=314263 RepID=UPI001C0987B4|nr:AAA family ATPase [Roseovarius nubinhibens]